MNTTMTPAEELRAAAKAIHESARPIVTWNGANIGPMVADWLTVVGDDMDLDYAEIVQHPEWIGYNEDMRWAVKGLRGLESEAWKSALIAARAINGETQPEPAPRCEAPQTPDCPYPPTHVADYLTGKTAVVGDKVMPLTHRIPVCGACVNDVPGLHRVQLNGGAR